MILALTTLLALALAPQDPRAGAEPNGDELVSVELLCDRVQIHPGEHFALAAKLTITPRWHIYWGENPGDTGTPTRTEIDAPKDFTIFAPRFPVPTRHTDPGPLFSFVYENEAVVIFDAVAPEKLEAGSKVHFELDASWLVCTTHCYEGQGQAALDVECAAAGEPALKNEKLFAGARAKLPRPLAQLHGLDSVLTQDSSKPGEVQLELRVAGATELSFMPADQRDPAFVSATATRDEKGPKLVLVYRWRTQPATEGKVGFPGILTVTTTDGPLPCWLDRTYSVKS
ncbi:MAG: hypothetical protein IPJ19_17380 [Planctomycetes bacterium]|nr:hypothetical protein [Planctomycetota bacterium]